ncbi:ATP-dependent DNA helicase [Actinomadura chokoriensis]|uniref:ATP-dependent helicase n=1 Tax=Actinomadura chokoriensis TaxID=454156 RepID=UPI0031F7C61C
MEFTGSQTEAINADVGNLLVLACAGSGKTEVIAQRIVNLLSRPDVQPRNIVAFTFTEKAAGELTERVHKRIKERYGEMLGLAEMFIGTIHGYALDLLHSQAPEAFKFNVLNDPQARLFIDKYSAKSGLTATTKCVRGVREPLRRWVHSRLYQQVMAVLREDEVDRHLLRPDLAEAFAAYEQLLNDRNYFDYSAILARAVDYMEDDEGHASARAVQHHIRENVRHVIVDEYQDINPIQERLIRGLTRYGADLCVVGDDDQTIYQWRGSAVTNILTFEDRHPDAKRITLNENFRSSPAVTQLARAAIEEIPASARLGKAMVAAGHQTFDRGDLLALEFSDQLEEARGIADRIETLLGVPFRDDADGPERGLSYADFAVLYRSVRGDAGPLVEEFRRRGIPYIIKGLTQLFDTPEVRAAVACFRYIAGYVDADTVREAWRVADVGCDDRVLDRGMAVLDEATDWDDSRPRDSITLQGVFLRFLEQIGLLEETVPSRGRGGSRGEIVFYNLGRFSTAIGDYEAIYLTIPPRDRFEGFAKWIEFQAPAYYEESDGDNGYARPDAVIIATVHQAKGMQWPAVFIPALRRNTFPMRRAGGLNIFHVIDRALVPNAARYEGGIDDERRLFYVAVTRAQKYLMLSFAPNGKQTGRRSSEFFDAATRNDWVLTRTKDPSDPRRLPPVPKHGTLDVVLSFSDLKYLFECPYSFKLRLLYGFDSPLQKELGYGKSLHDMMAEIHKRAIKGDIADLDEAEALVDRHLNLPFANKAARDQLRPAAIASVRRYLREKGATLHQSEYSEQPVEIHPAPGVTVTGRIDLIRRLDTDEVSIVDFKSSERTQTEDVTLDQLHMYALGYRELTGADADLVEIHNLDKDGRSHRQEVDDTMLNALNPRVAAAGRSLRDNDLPRLDAWCKTCSTCDFAGICRPRE